MGSDRQFARFTGRHTAAGAGRGRCGATAGLRVGRPRHPPHSPTAVTPLTALLAPRLAPLTQSHCSVSQICGGRCRAHSAPRTAVLATWRCAAGTGWERQHPPGEPDNPLLCCAGQRNRNRSHARLANTPLSGERGPVSTSLLCRVSCCTVSPGRWWCAAAGDLVIAITLPAVQTGHQSPHVPAGLYATILYTAFRTKSGFCVTMAGASHTALAQHRTNTDCYKHGKTTRSHA